MPTASREQAYPEALSSREDRLVAQRRDRVDSVVDPDGTTGRVPAGGHSSAPADGARLRDDRPRVGLALSGGGIRSATFSLGVLQALARERLIGRIDFLSTVSGGGYVGAFLGCLFQRWRALHAGGPAAGGETTPAEAVRELLVSPHAWPCHWLRECGRYLIPNRGSDETVMLAAFLRNWVAVQVVLAVLLLAPLTLYRLGAALLEPTAFPPLVIVLVAALAALWLVPAGVAYWLAAPFALLLAGVAAGAARLAFPMLAGAAVAPREAALAVLAASLALTLVVGAYYRQRYPDLAERRRYLTAGLAMGLQATALVLGLGGVDALGGVLHGWLGSRPAMLTVPGLFAAAGAMAAIVQKIAPRLLAGATRHGRGSPARSSRSWPRSRSSRSRPRSSTRRCTAWSHPPLPRVSPP